MANVTQVITITTGDTEYTSFSDVRAIVQAEESMNDIVSHLAQLSEVDLAFSIIDTSIEGNKVTVIKSWTSEEAYNDWIASAERADLIAFMEGLGWTVSEV